MVAVSVAGMGGGWAWWAAVGSAVGVPQATRLFWKGEGMAAGAAPAREVRLEREERVSKAGGMRAERKGEGMAAGAVPQICVSQKREGLR